jgi:hypothetical protein
VAAEPAAAEPVAVGETGVESPARGLVAGEPAAERRVAGEPVAAELAVEERAVPSGIQPAFGYGHWQTQRAGERPARSTRSTDPSYSSQAHMARAAGLGDGLLEKSGEQIGEQTGEQLTEKAKEGRPGRCRRPGSRGGQQARAARQRRQQRATQCSSPMPLACTTQGQATSKSNGSSWEVADQVEIEGILDLGTWEAGGCMLPEGKKALPTHLVREVKRDRRYESRAWWLGATCSGQGWILMRHLR